MRIITFLSFSTSLDHEVNHCFKKQLWLQLGMFLNSRVGNDIHTVLLSLITVYTLFIRANLWSVTGLLLFVVLPLNRDLQSPQSKYERQLPASMLLVLVMRSYCFSVHKVDHFTDTLTTNTTNLDVYSLF
jgi:branched-subunit amino acid transport protein AzlD